MQQFFIAIILILGLSSYWLYNQNQTLTANNIKLEAAVEEQKQTINAIKESYEKQGEEFDIPPHGPHYKMHKLLF